jgi:hypothetical protein
MPQRTFVQTLLVAVFATIFACAAPAISAECAPAPCVADGDGAGGVPDGNFASDAAAREAPAPGEPVLEAARHSQDDSGAGSAIFSPFAGAREPEKRPFVLAFLFENDGRATAVSIALAAALAVTLVGIAAFAFVRRRSKP